MGFNRYNKTGTATYAQATTTWTHMTPVERIPGVDQMGVQVKGASTGWNGSTVQCILQGCNVDAEGGTAPGGSADWQDIDTISFTANATKYFGGADFLIGVQGFQWWRIKGNVSAGAPSADVTFSLVSNADFEQ